MSAKKRVMSGMRPTGRLHLGNYWGALKNWIALQDRYDCFFEVADWHMLTTGYEDTRSLQENIRELALDWLAAGLDPGKCVIFKHSDVPEHAELALLLSMVTPLSWLENNPTWKEQLQDLAKTKLSKMQETTPGFSSRQTSVLTKEIEQKILSTYGFLGYPVLQAADILLYGGELVPVGKDQLPHLEISREIARRFNSLYSNGVQRVLTEPQPLLSEAPKVPGLDGRKMSKSYGNALDLLETPQSLDAKIMSAYTDPNKIRRDDRGHPEPCAENPPGCAVFALHKLYSGYWERRKTECEQGQVGCVACKKDLLKSLDGPFAGFREAREKFAGQKGAVEKMLAEGARKAKAEAAKTMERVRLAMRLR